MAKYLNEFIETIKRNLGDPPSISEEIYEDSVGQAVKVYSRYKALTKVVDLVGSGTGVFDIALPASYSDGFSTISSVEYPYTATTQNPTYLQEGTDFRVYRNTTGLVLRFLSTTLTAADTARVTYTSIHTVTNTSSTVPEFHEDAISDQATSLLAEVVAAEFSNKARSSMNDIAIDFHLKSQQWHELADRYNNLFRSIMGLPDKGKGDTTPVVAWTDLDFRNSFGGDYLTHPNRYR